MRFSTSSPLCFIFTTCLLLVLLVDEDQQVDSFLANLPARRILAAAPLARSEALMTSSVEILTTIDPYPPALPTKRSYSVGKAILLLPKDADTQLSNFGRYSPYGTPTILEAAKHLSRKAYYFSNATVLVDVAVIYDQDRIRLLTPSPYYIVFEQESSSSKSHHTEQQQKQQHLVTQSDLTLLFTADALITISIQQESDVTFLQNIIHTRNMVIQEQGLKNKCHLCLDCAERTNTNTNHGDELVATYRPQHPSLISQILLSLPFTNQASAKRLYYKMKSLFNRWTSDDFTIALMLFFNRFPTVHDEFLHSSSSHHHHDILQQDIHIEWVKHSIDATWEKGPIRNVREFYNMMTKCGDCIGRCMTDTQCRECITKLSTIDTRDQVESYRTLVSYDGSELLKDFSLCILQKNNIFQCDARIPTLPKVEPLQVWRGVPTTHDIAQNLLIGHLDEETALEGSLRGSISWKVAAGANVAYDQFPSQNQLFYKGIGKTMWYDPIFRVKTIDGRDIWCKRHYRVRTGPIPGTFRFSVLDNGVTSDEYWTIVAADDNLQWIIFHYAGAASAVGLQYLGGLLCTIDGSLPPESDREMIWKKLRSAGIEPWELFVVDNDINSPALLAAGPPPLDFYRKYIRNKDKVLPNNIK